MTYPPPPYKDAVCGGPVAGEAICGTWWAYPSTAGMAYAASVPQIVFGDIVPAAGLGFGAAVPSLFLLSVLTPPAAGLAFGATPPSLVMSSTLFPPAAGLAFGASAVGLRAEQVYLQDDVCSDLDLDASTVLSLDLAPLDCLPT